MTKIERDMRSRMPTADGFAVWTIALAIGAASYVLARRPTVAQEPAESVCADNTPTVFHQCALEAAQSFEPPRRADGQPDLSGLWNRPLNSFEDIEEHPRTLDDNGGPTLVVDPPDGKVPMRPWADALRRVNATAYVHPAAACFLSGVPYIMYRPEPFQFLQTPEYFVILAERAHGYRIVYLDDPPPVGDNIRLWNGVSRGHWEGNTLVVETTHQNGLPWLDQRARFFTEDAHVVERLTLIGPNTIHYQATVEDPNVYTSPFTIAFAYRRNTVEGDEILEEACYENNEALLSVYRSLGKTVFTGITPEEARAATAADR